MQNLNDQIADYTEKDADNKKSIAAQDRRWDNAVTVQEVSRPGSPESARAVKEQGEAESKLWGLRGNGKRIQATLRGLKKQREHPGHAAYEAETEKMVKEAKRLRKSIDKKCVKLAATADLHLDALLDLAKDEAKLSQIDPIFDRYLFGRASVTTWIMDRLSCYTGSGAYPLQEGRPELPGSVFSAPGTVEMNIREAREKQAARKFRHAVQEDAE